ncbi:MAG: STAS domain-containing protein [Treponema sp.]|uniref:STAS domain-containing protein n=1 Tax=Treponema sp. TaxID=166 RepID=UPI001B569618|nr:STAS domain-containing protein [Treponema sp.]MBP3771738.1 STAS domain-containing protein [Treponema sp.]MBQ9280731.1 STAS domain-containing protein [Treponema sp.]
MTITQNKTPDGLELIVAGRLDTNTAPELESALKQIEPAKQTLYLNLKDIDYVSSAGLRVILLAHKIMLPTGGKMVLRQPSEFCTQVLEATGMDSILTIE